MLARAGFPRKKRKSTNDSDESSKADVSSGEESNNPSRPEVENRNRAHPETNRFMATVAVCHMSFSDNGIGFDPACASSEENSSDASRRLAVNRAVVTESFDRHR